MNFIRGHLIIDIKERVVTSKRSLNCTNFIYFDEPVANGKYLIDRINEHYPFYRENYACAEWKDIGAGALVEIQQRLRANKFFVYRKIDGKSYKIRKKLMTSDHIHLNFKQASVRVDYSYTTDCEEMGCGDTGICRCGRVTGARASVDIQRLAAHIYNENYQGKTARRNGLINRLLYGHGNEMDLYCIDRVLRANKAWLSEKWAFDVTDGYYGEVLSGVEMREDFLSKVNSEIDTVLSLGLISEKVEFLLRLEYGSVLPELAGKRYEIRSVSSASVRPGSQGQARMAAKARLEFYSDENYRGIRCLAVEQDGEYRIVDGYHRMAATRQAEALIIAVY